MTTSLSLADLRRQYFGGGSDAEYAHLLDLYDAGVSADDVLGSVGLSQARSSLMPSGAIAETYDRRNARDNLTYLSSGRLQLVAVALRAGDVVTSITVFGNAATNTPLNQWFALYSPARVKLAVTNDATNAAWGAETFKTLSLTVPYTITTTGLYYIGICVVATTPPTLVGMNPTSFAIAAAAPILSGFADAGLTTPATAPETAIALTGRTPFYAYVS